MGLRGVEEQNSGASSRVHLPYPLLQGCILQCWSLGMHEGRVFTCSACSVLGRGSLDAPGLGRQHGLSPRVALNSYLWRLLIFAGADG